MISDRCVDFDVYIYIYVYICIYICIYMYIYICIYMYIYIAVYTDMLYWGYMITRVTGSISPLFPVLNLLFEDYRTILKIHTHTPIPLLKSAQRLSVLHRGLHRWHPRCLSIKQLTRC